MNFSILYTEKGEADLLALPEKVRGQIKKKIERLTGGFVGDILKLEGATNLYRLRSGDFRIIFSLNGSTLVILAIRDRKKAYE